MPDKTKPEIRQKLSKVNVKTLIQVVYIIFIKNLTCRVSLCKHLDLLIP